MNCREDDPLVSAEGAHVSVYVLFYEHFGAWDQADCQFDMYQALELLKTRILMIHTEFPQRVDNLNLLVENDL